MNKDNSYKCFIKFREWYCKLWSDHKLTSKYVLLSMSSCCVMLCHLQIQYGMRNTNFLTAVPIASCTAQGNPWTQGVQANICTKNGFSIKKQYPPPSCPTGISVPFGESQAGWADDSFCWHSAVQGLRGWRPVSPPVVNGWLLCTEVPVPQVPLHFL